MGCYSQENITFPTENKEDLIKIRNIGNGEGAFSPFPIFSISQKCANLNADLAIVKR